MPQRASPVCFTHESDSQSLIEDQQRQDRHTLHKLRQLLAEAVRAHFTLAVLVCDVVCVLMFTMLTLTVDKMVCEEQTRKDVLEWCQPWRPVDHVIVDLNFDLLVHCDLPRSCVAYAESLMERQGFNYNFIVGDEDLVYVGKGYRCRSDALRLQMLITRYTWDPKQPVYRIPEEVVVRYSELLYEGVQCGKVAPNFTVRVTCSVYGDWCGADNIRDRIPWQRPGALAHAHEDRHPWHEPEHGQHAFLAFDTDRVYDRRSRLQACNTTTMATTITYHAR